MMDRGYSSFKCRHALHFDKEKQETCDHTKRFEILTQTDSKVAPTLFAIDIKFKLKGYWPNQTNIEFSKIIVTASSHISEWEVLKMIGSRKAEISLKNQTHRSLLFFHRFWHALFLNRNAWLDSHQLYE